MSIKHGKNIFWTPLTSHCLSDKITKVYIALDTKQYDNRVNNDFIINLPKIESNITYDKTIPNGYYK